MAAVDCGTSPDADDEIAVLPQHEISVDRLTQPDLELGPIVEYLLPLDGMQERIVLGVVDDVGVRARPVQRDDERALSLVDEERWPLASLDWHDDIHPLRRRPGARIEGHTARLSGARRQGHDVAVGEPDLQ